MNAYISMWLKIYYEKEYFSSLFNHSTSSDLSWFIKQAKTRGIKVNDCRCKETANEFLVDYNNDAITFGLNKIKSIQKKDIEIINKIDTNNLHELIKYILDKKVSKRTVEPLCRLQYFKHIFENSKLLEFIYNETKSMKKSENIEEKIDKIIDENKMFKDWSKNELFQFEKQYFEFYFNEHPFIKTFEKIEAENPDVVNSLYTPKNLNDDLRFGKYILCGIINDIILKKSKKTGRAYYKIILEDDENQTYITIFNSRDISDIKKGDFIVMRVSKNNFGFTKSKDSSIKKIS
jgi:DNA polymerase III alpha subunit